MKNFLILLFAGILLTLSSCDSSNDPIVVNLRPPGPIKVNFDQSEGFLTESDGNILVNLEFSRAAITAGTITIMIDEVSGLYNQDYSTIPIKSGQSIVLDFPAGSTSSNFTLMALADSDNDIEIINFEVTAVSGENMTLGSAISYTVTIEDESTIDPRYAACLTPLSSQTLDIVTWNIEFFPMNSSTVGLTKDIIENLDADIIAVQEIDEPVDFEELISQLDGWNGAYYNVNGRIELGYLYKTSEISSFGSLSVIFGNDRSAFPREPVLVNVKHINGMEVTLINLHLKCCNDGEARRGNASVLLKDYIDTNLASENVIVLGDLNDDILGGSPFSNFISDSDNYSFVDADIASGSSSNWSYPSWPSHLDHILISNELFDEFESVKTIKLSSCVSNYSSSVSDHRPVMASFR